jgi:hypothetical protein
MRKCRAQPRHFQSIKSRVGSLCCFASFSQFVVIGCCHFDVILQFPATRISISSDHDKVHRAKAAVPDQHTIFSKMGMSIMKASLEWKTSQQYCEDRTYERIQSMNEYIDLCLCLIVYVKAWHQKYAVFPTPSTPVLSCSDLLPVHPKLVSVG